MARPTRQARRERREQQRADRERDTTNGAAASAARRPQPVAATAEAEIPGVHHRGGVIGFIGECIAELKKVEWPNRAQVIQGTIVVIIACVIVGVFLYGADQILKPFVRTVLLGQ